MRFSGKDIDNSLEAMLAEHVPLRFSTSTCNEDFIAAAVVRWFQEGRSDEIYLIERNEKKFRGFSIT